MYSIIIIINTNNRSYSKEIHISELSLSFCMYVCSCVHVVCEDKFGQKCSIARLWEDATFDFLLHHN